MKFRAHPLATAILTSIALAACGGSEEVIEDRDVEDATESGEGDAQGGDTSFEPDAGEDAVEEIVEDVVEPDVPEPDVIEPDVEEDITEPDISEDTGDVGIDVTCDPGFELIGSECVDIDECATETDDCDVNAACTNIDGGFECACNDGFEGDGVECTEIPVCDPICSDNAECAFVEGAPTCQCLPGFEGDPLEACTDIDECGGAPVTFTKSSTDPDTAVDCLAPSVCIGRSSSGGPIFNSVAGEVGGRAQCGGVDGETGEPRIPDVVVAGAEWSFGRCGSSGLEFVTFLDEDFAGCRPPAIVGQEACVHILEEDVFFDITFTDWGGGETGPGAFEYTRSEYTGVCGTDALCANTEGSFDCTCPDGYEGDATVACLDTDECADDPCGTDECINEPGTFICVCETESFARTIGGVQEDCISGDVCIARDATGPIYNSVVETGGRTGCSEAKPTGTLWSDERCAASEEADFGAFLSSSFADCSPPDVVDVEGCLLIEASGELYDIAFTDWGVGSGGGGTFAYDRTRVSVGAACD